MSKILELRVELRDYAWGSPTLLSELLGIENRDGGPQAELWMGAHPAAPSHVSHAGVWVSLLDWIADDPSLRLGRQCTEAHGDELPFLFKVLAAGEPLSLQAHPNAAQARAGFERENRAGLSLEDPRRDFRDPHPKPEILCALSPFDALLGFRRVEEIVRLVGALDLPELHVPLERLATGDEGALADFFATLMHGESAARRALAYRVAARSASIEDDSAYTWVCRLASAYPDDLGVIAPLLLNVIHLEVGQAVYLPAGELHSYLSGCGIELMGNSDNVLRGGLTHKHIDVDALLDILSFRTGDPELLEPVEREPGVSVYLTPASQFELTRIDVAGEYLKHAAGPVEILLCTKGAGRIARIDGDEIRSVERGQVLLIPADAGPYRLEGDLQLFRASLPVGSPQHRCA